MKCLSKMTEELNFKSICSIATSVMDLPKDSLSSKSRKSDIAVVRQVVAYIGRTEEDIHRKTIGKILNRDRTSINYYENTHKINYATYPLYRNTFNKIYKAYKDIESTKSIFFDKEVMKSHLLKSGVKEVLDADVILEVKSGSVACKVKTSYFDFSNQLENVKLALKNYHFSVKII